MAASQSVDSVARHNIFMTNIKPRIDQEFSQLKFGLISVLSHCMMVMPFSTDHSVKANHTPSAVFEFGAKMKEVSPLAMSQESNTILSEAMYVSDAYAMLINNITLMGEDKPGRFILMMNNFVTASDDFSRAAGYEPAALRFAGLALLCQGGESLMNGDVPTAYNLFQQGNAKLKEASSKLMGNLKVAVMGQAVKQELVISESLIELTSYVNSLGGSREVFDAVRKIFGYHYPAQGNWAFMLNDKNRNGEILSNLSACIKAKSGEGTVAIAAGSGDVLVPFWDVELRYSFQTGTMWKKRTVEVQDSILISANFVIDAQSLSNPQQSVTDVFKANGGNGFLAGLTGNESKITSSGPVDSICKSVAQNGISGRAIIVPLSTKREAERQAENYLQVISSSDNKLKLVNPEIRGLIYVPFTRSGNSLTPNGDFKNLLPDCIPKTNLENLILL